MACAAGCALGSLAGHLFQSFSVQCLGILEMAIPQIARVFGACLLV